MKPILAKKPELGAYSVAPYNFVSFPKRAVVKYTDPSQLPPHNNFKNRSGKELLSGFIQYTLKAETPIMVGGGGKDRNRDTDKDVFFFKNSDGDYAIPGNTIRGLLRTNSQILSFSNIIKADDSGGYGQSEIQDSKFLFRDVAGNNALSDKYKEILNIDPNKRVSRNLRAGYIYNEKGQYYIEESEKLSDLRNYFRLDEIYLRKILDPDIVDKVRFMYKREMAKHEEKFKELNKKMAPSNNYRIRNDARREKLSIIRRYKSQGRDSYQPYNLEVSFSLDKKTGRITKIGNKERYSNQGYLLSGGQIDGKLSHYLVPAPGKASSRIEISTENIIQYKDDLILTKKMDKGIEKINKGYEFFDLPQRGNVKPIFFINTDRLHFGFTPYLRMFYSKSILDGLGSEYKDVKGISYADSIFGFTNMNFAGKDYSYRSRVSFEDVIADKNAQIDKDSTMEMLLAEPKPTSYNLYLQQDVNKGKKELNIYEDDFNIRGIKQYWMKNYIEKPDIGSATNMSFIIHPLKEGTEFKGKIYFTNLEEDELGLILWALKLENNCYQSIGLAKPYGFGRVKVSNIELKIENLEKKYGEFSFDFMDSGNVDDYINIYKSNFSDQYLNGKDIEEEKPIRELICIKSTIIDGKDSNWYRYMELPEFRHKKVLPSILEYADLVKKEGTQLHSKASRHQSGRRDKKDNRSVRDRGIGKKKTPNKSRDRDNFSNTMEGAKGWEKLKNLKFD